MIGTLLKQLFVALGRFFRYQTMKTLRISDTPVVAMPEMVESVSEPSTVCTATDNSIRNLSSDIGLNSSYEALIQWPCHRVDLPPPEVAADKLYKLWTTIPQGLKWTQYFQVYEAIFGPRRSFPLRILEIGIWQGSSLKLWKKYFNHPKTIIVGIDVLPECNRFDAPTDGVHIRIGSQADAEFLKNVVEEFGPFDLIMDDGSHHSSHIIESFNHLFDNGLKDSGIYFVEDLHANYWHPWRDSRKSFLDVCKDMLEHMHAHYRNSTPVDFLVGTPSARQAVSIEVPRITTMIKEIRFFDSMVAIYKADLKYVPYSIHSSI